MANIFPFNGIRFDPAVCGNVDKLIAPPYDVIDPALRDTLFRLSPHNIARVTKADRDEKAASGNPYEAAGALWREWIASGVVKRDAQPAVYVYEQHFEVHGRRFSRTAMIALLRIEASVVLPHENTLSGPKADRLQLMRATATQFGQVFGLYPDSTGRVEAALNAAKASRPLAQASDTLDLLHRLWAITDPAAIAEIQAGMSDKDLLIADGHHRFETSVAYMKENPQNEAAKCRMMAMVNMSNPGLVILPIHRCVKGLRDFKPAAFLAALRKDFDVRSYPGDSPGVRAAVLEEIRLQQGEGRHAFALYMSGGSHHVVGLRNEEAMKRIQGRSDAWRRLDVAILHHLILEPLMGITAERLAAESNVEYVQDLPHAIGAAAETVRDGRCQALFLLNPTRAGEVQAVARNHERMPQKSTFFYPKMYSGLVVYRME